MWRVLLNFSKLQMEIYRDGISPPSYEQNTQSVERNVNEIFRSSDIRFQHPLKYSAFLFEGPISIL